MSSLEAPEFSRNLAVFGTASDVGKSTLAAAFGRLFANAGIRVAPYKAQNMSNNAYVARDGGEIGRAQYVQAVACRVEPSVHHNPVLLKPQADDLSQIVLHGRALSQVKAKDYFASTSALRDAAYGSLARLQHDADVVVLEGAGSCAEVNLRAREFVNFPAAHAARASVVLVADIEKGGVFAQLVGSLEVMPEEDRARVRGLIVNKFRGDATLFDEGVTYLERRTGVPVLGVIPFVHGLELEAEDALPLHARVPASSSESDALKVAVIQLPHISNFTDFDALARCPSVSVHYLRRAAELDGYAAVVLPGTKAVVGDLHWLRDNGLASAIERYSASGGRVLGICGGYQMLGRRILDPLHLESDEDVTTGLGLLDVETVFESPKVVRRVNGVSVAEGAAIDGYQIHFGRVRNSAHAALLELDVEGQRLAEGARDDVGRIWASTVHGLFDEPAMCGALLRWLGAKPEAEPGIRLSQRAWLDQELEAIAEHVRRHIDFERVLSWVR